MCVSSAGYGGTRLSWRLFSHRSTPDIFDTDTSGVQPLSLDSEGGLGLFCGTKGRVSIRFGLG